MIRTVFAFTALLASAMALAKEVPLSSTFNGTWSDQNKQHFCIVDVGSMRQPRVHFACQFGADAVVVDSGLNVSQASWDFPISQRKSGLNERMSSQQGDWMPWGHMYGFIHCRDWTPKMVLLIQRGLDVVEIELQPHGFKNPQQLCIGYR